MPLPPYNTDNLQLTQFDAHGSVSLEIEGRILRVRAKGPFNREFVETMAAMERPVFSQMGRGGPWAEIVIFSHSMLATADALALFPPYLKELQSRGLAPVGTAFVLEDTLEGATIMRERYMAAYAGADWPCAFFSHLAEADAWARQKLDAAAPLSSPSTTPPDSKRRPRGLGRTRPVPES